jgi:shikimate kinase
LLRDKHSRPLIKNISDTELQSFIVKKLQGRKFYYEQADIMIPEDALTLDLLIKTIEDA